MTDYSAGDSRAIPWQELFQPIPGMKPNQINVICPVQEVVPIVFVPGIMGSVLWGWDSKGGKNRKGANEIVWNPPDGAMMLWRYGMAFRSAADKRELLIGRKFSPHHLWVNGTNAVDSPERGWEGVASSSYGSIRTMLESQPWHPVLKACFHMPVHAFGYNWTVSNADSAKRLKNFVNALIQFYRDNHGRKNGHCERVILVTRSLGGLVARYACLDAAFRDNVVGVVHGVQPVDGAPAAFWRMKAGFERSPASLMSFPSAWVLGSDGREVTALLANMPGGLQLLPNKHYRTADGRADWLRFHWGHLQKDPRSPWIDLEQWRGYPERNAYAEIYRVRDASALARMVDPLLLNPSAKTAADVDTEWSYYLERITEAERFHDMLGHHAHPNTVTFHGTGCVTASTVDFLCESRVPEPEEWGAAPWPNTERYDSEGYTRTMKNPAASQFELLTLTLLPAREFDGDGTVPATSASALRAHGHPARHLEHEPAYKSASVLDFTKRSISKMLTRYAKEELEKYGIPLPAGTPVEPVPISP